MLRLILFLGFSTSVSYPFQIKNANTPGAEKPVDLMKTNAILQTHRLASQRVGVQFISELSLPLFAIIYRTFCVHTAQLSSVPFIF